MDSNISAWGQFSRMTWKSEVRRLELFDSIITHSHPQLINQTFEIYSPTHHSSTRPSLIRLL